jgi:putative (di)nucleoside polyphosphate hydrolase
MQSDIKDTHNSQSTHDPFYRLGVGMMVVNHKGQVLVCKRVDGGQGEDQGVNQESIPAETANPWQMPQGGIEFDEDPYGAALRELTEEIGTAQVSLIAKVDEWLSYDFPKPLAKKLWGGRFIGQKQKWFLLRYEGYESDINLNTAHPEFSDFKWVDPADLPQLIVDFKKDLYRDLLERLNPTLEKLKRESIDQN